MARSVLRSDMSDQESMFFTYGSGFCGEENTITGLFKLIGKFNELNEFERKQEITEYIPEKDKRFKYENRGYSDMSKIIKNDPKNKDISRKHLKNISRKWCFTPVVLSFKTDYIVSQLVEYIKHDTDLYLAFGNYLKRSGEDWSELMPVQFDFLSTRHTDQHKHYREAGRIINELSDIVF